MRLIGRGAAPQTFDNRTVTGVRGPENTNGFSVTVAVVATFNIWPLAQMRDDFDTHLT